LVVVADLGDHITVGVVRHTRAVDHKFSAHGSGIRCLRPVTDSDGTARCSAVAVYRPPIASPGRGSGGHRWISRLLEAGGVPSEGE
jgi:hypothetical protein